MSANSSLRFFSDATTSGKERRVPGIKKKEKSRLFIATKSVLERNRLKTEHYYQEGQ
jgi:hypothetical protein